MNSKTAIALIIFATLAIGTLLGFLGRGALIKHRTQRLNASERMEFFTSRINETIQPDSVQAPQIDRIVRRASEHITVLFDHHEEEISLLIDSMKHELSLLLRPEQIHRLETELKFSQRDHRNTRSLGVSKAFSYEYAERLQGDLDLDSFQTDQLLIIFRDAHDRFIKQIQAEREDTAGTRKLRNDFIDQTNNRIELILTSKQREQFRHLRREQERFIDHEFGEEKFSGRQEAIH